MPELPEVETVVRGIRPQLEGRSIARCVHASELMAECDEGNFTTRLRGKRVLRIDRQGKWIFCRLEGDQTLVLHLGMTGHLRVEPRKRAVAPHTHLRVLLSGGEEELRLSDPRRFGEIILLGPSHFHDRFGPARLGPDALSATADHWRSVLATTARSLKAVLLDQRAVAGIGNIYADEILFDAGFHPARRGRTLRADEVDRLVQSTARILREAIKLGGSTIRDYVNSEGTPGWFQISHRVYGQEGKPCVRCGGPIKLSRTILTGRATHFCPNCQTRTRSAVSQPAGGRKISASGRRVPISPGSQDSKAGGKASLSR